MRRFVLLGVALTMVLVGAFASTSTALPADFCDQHPNHWKCQPPPPPPPSAACADGIDNDSDGLVDYPADPGCISVTDTDETDPPPPPPPGSVSWSNGFGTWGDSNIPDTSWRPFADTSPWNTPVPASPTLDLRDAQTMTQVRAWSSANSQGGAPMNLEYDPDMARREPNGSDWAHPLFFARAGDPAYTIHCYKYACPNLEGRSIPIPSAARPADGGDGHMGVVFEDPAYPGYRFVADMYETYLSNRSGSTWSIGSGGMSRIDGSGMNVDTDSGWNITRTGLASGEATASQYSVLAGMIRGVELEAGHIPHALFMTALCGTDNPRFVYPAQKEGAICSDATQRANAPSMGARFWLDMTNTEINALAIKASMKTILKALHEYGGFMGDTGGNSYAMMFESPETYHSWGLQSPILGIAQAESWIFSSTVGYILRPRDIPSSVWDRVHVLAPPS